MLASATELRERFAVLCERPIEQQTQFFLRSFLNDLEDVNEVMSLQASFTKYLSERNERSDLSPIQAANFLEKNGKTRTALQRKNELADVDLDQNGRISFIEYLLLHYKVMILDTHYRRTGKELTHDLSNDGIGLTGVGNELLTELYNIPDGIPLELQKQVDEFMEAQREREAKIEQLKKVVETGGRVAAGKAAHELKVLTSSDWDEEKYQLQAAIRMAKDRTGSSTVMVAKHKAENQKKQQQKMKTAKSKLQLMQEKYKSNARKGINATIQRA